MCNVEKEERGLKSRKKEGEHGRQNVIVQLLTGECSRGEHSQERKYSEESKNVVLHCKVQ